LEGLQRRISLVMMFGCRDVGFGQWTNGTLDCYSTFACLRTK
jgi:hypothetical protein